MRRNHAGGADFGQTLGNFLRYSFLESTEKLNGGLQVYDIRIAATPCYPDDSLTKLGKPGEVLRPELINCGQRYQPLEFANCLVLMRGFFSVTMEIPGQQVRPQSQLIWAGIRHDLAPKL